MNRPVSRLRMRAHAGARVAAFEAANIKVVRKGFTLHILLAAMTMFLIVLPQPVFGSEKEVVSRGAGCLACHEGIEVINAKMALEWGADTRCEVCHYGKPSGTTKFEAHAGLIANPGDLRVIFRTCGKCHSDYGETANVQIDGMGDHVGRVERSLMATAAGEIAGTRYMWAAQNSRSAIYGVRSVMDADDTRPKGAVEWLQALPAASESDADSLLRSECLRCHLWTEDKASPGVFRAGGCSACHVIYAQDGLSQTGDPTVPKDDPGHPQTHVITTKIPDSQCVSCHNNGGARIGLSYLGIAVTNSSLGLGMPTAGEKAAYGVSIVHTRPDVHHRRGLSCIDCHDSFDVHGDGNIYSHQEYQVGIRCETCHGTSTSPPTFKDARGNKLRNVEIEEGKPYLRNKIFIHLHPIPVLFSDASEPPTLDDIWHNGHQRLECYACHSVRVPQCYTCHMTRDDRKQSQVDWVAGIGEGQSPQTLVGRWTGRTLVQEWSDPILGVNNKGRISPFVPGGQAVLTRIDADGSRAAHNHTFTTPGGLYGFSMNPVQPHTISTESRTCSSCHSSRKALGLGTGFFDLKRRGLSLNFSPDRFVNEEGDRIQDSAHEDARPLSGKELSRILRTEACGDCHDKPMKTMQGPEPPLSLNAADRYHHQAIRKALIPQGE